MNHLSTTCLLISLSLPAWAHAPGPVSDSDPSPSQPQIEIVEKDGYRIIKSNAVPGHAVGRFPNRGNPHTMTPQIIELRVPLQPKQSSQPVSNHRGFFGVALNGVPFEPHTAEWWKNDRSSGWRMEVKSPRHNLGLDQNNAHVQSSGLYHYHGPPAGLIKGKGMQQIGWAADGYPIYSSVGHADSNDLSSPVKRLKSSWQLKKGQRPAPPSGPGGRYDGVYEQDFEFVAGSGDLDEFNGRFGVTPEFPEGTYHYVVTEEFPFLSRQFKGIPDRSFLEKGGIKDHHHGRGHDQRPPGRGLGKPPRPGRERPSRSRPVPPNR